MAPTTASLAHKEAGALVAELGAVRGEAERGRIVQTLHTRVLPRLARRRDLKGLALCVTVSDVDVQAMAASLLQAQLLQLKYR